MVLDERTASLAYSRRIDLLRLLTIRDMELVLKAMRMPVIPVVQLPGLESYLGAGVDPVQVSVVIPPVEEVVEVDSSSTASNDLPLVPFIHVQKLI